MRETGRLCALVVATIWTALVPSIACASDASQAIAARNPFFAELKKSDPKTFEAAVAVIERREREKGVDPGAGVPPPPEPVERGMRPDAGRDLTEGNPDILWLYNASPEGMNDLISLLKSAGQRPKQ